MTIRIAQQSDAASIAAISIEVWIGTYLKKGVKEVFAQFALEEFTVEKTQALLASPSEHILVSENVDGIDGFIRISSGKPGPVAHCSDTEIATFYVQPRHHGKGGGMRLLQAGLAYCKDQSVTSVWLTTNAENTPAIGFYLSQGFEHIGQTDFVIDGTGYLNNVYRRDLS